MSLPTNRPWPYWFEVHHRPRFWWRDMWILPYGVWRTQQAERELFAVIPFEEFKAALYEKDT